LSLNDGRKGGRQLIRVYRWREKFKKIKGTMKRFLLS